jgi:hypothetical protein
MAIAAKLVQPASNKEGVARQQKKWAGIPDSGNTAVSEMLPPILVQENVGGFRIRVPISDIDLRKIWIFAAPHSICIEFRSRDMVHHSEASCREIDEQRTVRELRLSQKIKEGCTNARPAGHELQITCLKDSTPDDTNWAEMINFDTRASLGTV